MLESLEKVILRGEQLELLQQKTSDLQSVGRTFHRNTKKMNSWWGNWGCIGCGNDSAMSRGAASIKTIRIARKVNKKQGELGLL
jgi:hypothetical protein